MWPIKARQLSAWVGDTEAAIEVIKIADAVAVAVPVGQGVRLAGLLDGDVDLVPIIEPVVVRVVVEGIAAIGQSLIVVGAIAIRVRPIGPRHRERRQG